MWEGGICLAKRVEGVTEKLLECAVQEFLEKGYEKASLRAIAKRAGSSMGAIYIRYPEKKDLYLSIVENTMNGFYDIISSTQNAFDTLPPDEQKKRIKSENEQGCTKMVEYIYAHFDEFKILFVNGENEIQQNFLHRLVDIESAGVINFLKAINNDAISSGKITQELMHLLWIAFYSAVFEIVIHDMPFNIGVEHINQLNDFYTGGWQTIYNR